MKKIFMALSLFAISIATYAWKPADLLHNYSYYARAAYNLGGTAPIGMPSTIRKMNSYSLRPNFMLGVDAFHPFNDRWGIMFGLHFENKGMKVDATVKNYHMKMVQGGESIEGMFTGRVMTQVDQSLGTIPVQATYDLSDKVRLKLGPYFSYVSSHKFSGYAYDGYLREGSPTGPKIELGNDANSRGDFDFSGDMRNWQFGIDSSSAALWAVCSRARTTPM